MTVWCERVHRRTACDECGYPYCEAMTDTDPRVPHEHEIECPRQYPATGKCICQVRV